MNSISQFKVERAVKFIEKYGSAEIWFKGNAEAIEVTELKLDTSCGVVRAKFERSQVGSVLSGGVSGRYVYEYVFDPADILYVCGQIMIQDDEK